MWGRNRRKDVSYLPSEVSRQRVRRLVKLWDVEDAKYFYELRRATEITYEDGSRALRKPGQAIFDSTWSIEARGNKAWANRTATHFDLKIEVEADD